MHLEEISRPNMNGWKQIDYHSQDNKKSEAMSGRSQDVLQRNSTHGGTTDTRHTAMTPRALPLFCLWDLASALDPSPTSLDQRPLCVGMEVQLERHTGGPPSTYSWNDAVVADVVCNIVPNVCMMGPGSAYLFFGRQTINEGSEREEAHQIGNFLTGPVTLVGCPASMLASEYPLVKGRQAVATAQD